MVLLMSDNELFTPLPSINQSEMLIERDAEAACRSLITYAAEDLAESLGLQSYLRRYKEAEELGRP